MPQERWGPSISLVAAQVGTNATLQLATGNASELGASECVVGVDDSSVYWLDADRSSLNKTAKYGGGAKIFVASLGSSGCLGVAIDSTYVWFVDSSGGISRFPK
jgi:hypothetical protein